MKEFSILDIIIIWCSFIFVLDVFVFTETVTVMINW